MRGMAEATMKKRRCVKVFCSSCNRKYWTSAAKRPYTCYTCRRAAGLLAASRSTALTVAPRQVLSFGTCQSSHMHEQELSNGKCVMCRFYAMADIDPDLSERAKRSAGGEFDWVRVRR